MADSRADATGRGAPEIVILGADAVIAARPATPVQLAQGCLAAGYRAAVPATWGDELVAGACARAAKRREGTPVIVCACPRVAERLLAAGDDLEPFLVPLLSPPAAAARYVHAALRGTPPRVTFVGECPGAAHSAIDERITPAAFLSRLAARGIRLAEQPEFFDSVIPADRRRFESIPGGAPDPGRLAATAPGHELVELADDDFVATLAQRLIADRTTVIDIAPRLGCACSGAAAGVSARDARAVVTRLEPPRAASPVIDEAVFVDVLLPNVDAMGVQVRSPRRSASPGVIGPADVPPASRPAARPIFTSSPPPGLPAPAPTPAPRAAHPPAADVTAVSDVAPRPSPVAAPAATRSPAAVAMPTAATPSVNPETSNATSDAIPRPAARLTPTTTSPLVSPPQRVTPLAADAIDVPTATSRPPRRRSPAEGTARAITGPVPTTRSSDGRAYPRAYGVLRRNGEAPRVGPRPSDAERPIEPAVEPPAPRGAAQSAIASAAGAASTVAPIGAPHAPEGAAASSIPPATGAPQAQSPRPQTSEPLAWAEPRLLLAAAMALAAGVWLGATFVAR